jgi:hypothetical protein
MGNNINFRKAGYIVGATYYLPFRSLCATKTKNEPNMGDAKR